MSEQLLFNEAEVTEPGDFTAIGEAARDDIASVVGGAIGAPSQWARVTITQPSASTLNVQPGELFAGDVLYSSTTPILVNLMANLSLVLGDTKWVALLLRGTTETRQESRLVETDADTGETSAQMLPKRQVQGLTIVVQDGVGSPTPIKPVVPAAECCIAFVLLSSTGIETIEPGLAWRMVTLYELTGRVIQLEADMDAMRQRTAVLETTVANIQGRLGDIPRPELMIQLQRDAAAVRKQLDLPDEARAYWYDPGLLKDDWDTAHAAWLARVAEGLRMPWAQIVDSQLALLTPADPLLKIVDTLALPKYTEVARIAVEGADGTRDISQQVHTEITAVQKTLSGTSIIYGPTQNYCENAREWAFLKTLHPGETFSVNGKEYILDGLQKDGTIAWVGGMDASAYNASPWYAGHRFYSIRQVQYEAWSETYWDYITKEVGVNGSIYGQTLLNAQPCIVTSIELNFSRVGSDGAVHLMLCSCDETGAPDFSSVLAVSEIAAADLVVGWNRFAFTPTLLDAGRRYAWYTVTVGNHALVTVANNKFAQGSLFWATDGAWAQGDPVNDFAFRLNVAKFASTRTQIAFQPLGCPDGMTQIQLLYAGWAPAGTSLIWEVKPVDGDWIPIQMGDATGFAGLPALAQLRATFVGTTDLAPALRLDSTARAATMRPQSVMQAMSKPQAFGFSTSSIMLVTVVDAFDAALHTAVNRLWVAGAFVEADSTTVEVDIDKPSRRKITSMFELAAPVTEASAAPKLTTSSVVSTPFVQNTMMIGI